MATLLVASTGGHLRELHRLRPRLPQGDGERLWITNDTVQSRSLLADEDVVYIPYQGSRNIAATIVNVCRARDVVKGRNFCQAISTGSAIAMSFLPVAAAYGAECHYIESCTRVKSPSVTGRLLRWVPRVTCYMQHEDGARSPWRYGGSVLDGFRPVQQRIARVRRIVVTLGTWRQPFRRLLRRVIEILPPGAEVVWQTGYTDVSGLGIESVPWLSPEELTLELQRADAVVTHAGMGATLDALEARKLPVVVPRRQSFGEQVDDHQVELAARLDHLGLAVARDAAELTTDTLVSAAGWSIEQENNVQPLLWSPQ